MYSGNVLHSAYSYYNYIIFVVGYYVSEKYDVIQEVFLDDALSYSQNVLGLQNVTFKEQEAVVIYVYVLQ